MDLRDYLRVLRMRWLAVVCTAGLGIAVAAAATAVTTPTYEATTRLFVSAQGAGPAGATTSQLIQGNDLARDRVQSYAQIVTSTRVLQPVIDSLGLATTPQTLADRVSAEAPKDTVLINISVTGSTAREVAETANAIGASLIDVVPSLDQTATDPGTPVTLSTVQEAIPQSAPLSPNPTLNLALGGLIGLALGLGLALLLEALDLRVRRAKDLAPLHLPVLGVIPKDADARRDLLVLEGARTAWAESYRQLRTNLRSLTDSAGIRSVVISSSVDGEGKSTTAANLAGLLAESGVRVLLVDADLRRPDLTGRFDLDGLLGLSSVLAGQVLVSDVVHDHPSIENLTLLPSGPVPPNPSELLSGEAFKSVIIELEASYDLVLLDAGPLVAVTDAAVIGQRAGGVVLVVRSGAVRSPTLERSLAALEAVDARLLGTVLTMLPGRGRRRSDDAYAPQVGSSAVGHRLRSYRAGREAPVVAAGKG